MAATDLERLVVQLSADVRGYQNALNKAQGVTNRQARAIESRFQKMSGNINRSFQDSLKGAVALAGTAISAREIQQYADAWTEAGNKIAAAGSIAGVQGRSLGELRQGADGARTSFETYVDLYAKLIRSASAVAKSEQEIATATDIVTKGFKAGGAATQEQTAGILQLSQALGSGILQGDELRSLRENAPLIAKAIADEFGTTVAGLKKLGEEGKLTSDRVFKAILAAQKPIEAAFNTTNATIADGFTKLKNAVTEYVGTQAQALGVTAAINSILAALAGNIESVAAAAAAAGIALAAAFAGPAIAAGAAALLNPITLLVAAIGAAAFAFTEFYDTVVPLQGSFATLGDYATALWQIIGEGAETTRATIVATFDTILESIDSALSGVGTSIEGVWEAVKSGINAIINSFRTLSDVVVATFDTVPAAIGDAVLSAMNAMVAGVETGINKVIAAVNAAIGAINSLGAYAGVAAIPALDSVSIGRLENSYAGAGERASKAFQDAVNRPATDYVGAAGDAIASSVDGAVNRITARANDIALARQELERETGRAGALSSVGDNAAGFGGGIKTGGAGTGKGGGGGSKGKKSKESDYQREIEQIKERTAALQAETAAQAMANPLIDDYGFASERARVAQELLTAAQKSGLAITPQLKETIDELATGYANASVEAQKLSDSQESMRQAAEDFRNTSKDVVSGFISDLRSGKSAAEALQGALDKVLDKVIDIALNAAFGIGGGGGGFLGALGSLFGFAGGGYTGNGGKYQPAGVVHKGEYVFDKQSVQKAGGPSALDAMRRGLNGYSQGGYVGSAPRLPNMSATRQKQQQVAVTVGVSADQNGNLMPFVQSVAQREVSTAAPKIVQAANAQAPMAVSKYQASKGGAEWR